MTNKLVEIKNLKKVYHTLNGEITAINDINFDVYSNEFICIVGPSGCGKSTLLNILANLDTAEDGSITLTKDNTTIGYMPQEDALFPWLTIKENALLGLEISKTKTRENVDYVLSLLETYGLKDFIDKYPSQLSGGMKQRVA